MPPKHIFLAILVSAIWGFNFVVVKLGVHEIPPLLLCTFRFFLASIPAVFFLPFPKGAFKQIALYGLVMFTLQFAFIFTGIAIGMTAGMASLLVQTQIFFSILVAIFVLKETPTLWQLLGALVAFSGIIVALFHLDHSTITLPGFLLVLAGALAWGVGNVISKNFVNINLFSVVAWGSLISFPPLLLLSFIFEGNALLHPESLFHMSSLALLCLLYITYISTWLGYGIWSWLITHYPISNVVPFTLLVPIFGMLGSTLVLHESLEPWKIIAAILVISGLCINILLPRFLSSKPVLE